VAPADVIVDRTTLTVNDQHSQQSVAHQSASQLSPYLIDHTAPLLSLVKRKRKEKGLALVGRLISSGTSSPSTRLNG
jgi:hypothetical protein